MFACQHLVCSPLLASLQPLVLGKLTEIYLDWGMPVFGPGYHLIWILKTREIPTATFPVRSKRLLVKMPLLLQLNIFVETMVIFLQNSLINRKNMFTNRNILYIYSLGYSGPYFAFTCLFVAWQKAQKSFIIHAQVWAGASMAAKRSDWQIHRGAQPKHNILCHPLVKIESIRTN